MRVLDKWLIIGDKKLLIVTNLNRYNNIMDNTIRMMVLRG